MNSNKKKEFEDELDKTIYGGYSSYNLDKKQSIYFQKRNGMLYRSILIIFFVFVGITIFSVYYNNKQYDENADHIIQSYLNVVQLSVNDYYRDYKKFPVTSDGQIDYETLEKEGYLTLDIEGYKSNFIFGKNYQVLKKD